MDAMIMLVQKIGRGYNMTDLTKTQAEIRALKELITIQRLRAYRHECLMADIASGVGKLEFIIEHGVRQYE